jgi:hypothetical protein
MVKTSTPVKENDIDLTVRQEEAPVRSWMEMYYEVGSKWMESIARNLDMKKFLCQYLDTMEGFFDTNPDLLSPEHKEEYISCAQFMEDNYGRLCNRIKEVKATL